MSRSSDKRALLNNFKVDEKKGIRLSFKGNRRVHTEANDDTDFLQRSSKMQFSALTAKSTNKNLKKPGITNTAKDRKMVYLKTEPSEIPHLPKKQPRKELDKDRKLFPRSQFANQTSEISKVARLKTEPSQPTNTSEIYKKLANISIAKEKPKQPIESDYQIEEVVGKGTFGKVYRARYLPTGQTVAIKTVLQDKRYKNRELQILKMLNHPNVLQIQHYFYTQQKGQEYLNVVMEYFDQTAYSLNKKYQMNFTSIHPILIKIYSYQLFRGLNYLASLNIAHRDIKPHNILVDTNTNRTLICDFGSAKQLVKNQANISYICSRCYRAPELIFGCTDYTPQIDMWSMGCVILQMINGEPPFMGDSQTDLLISIIKVLGTPDKQTVIQMNRGYDFKEYKFPSVKSKQWRKAVKSKTDPLLIDLISKVMKYSPIRRLTPFQAMCHPYFDDIRDQQMYNQIVSKTKYKGLYNFTRDQIKSHKTFSDKLMPPWVKKSTK